MSRKRFDTKIGRHRRLLTRNGSANGRGGGACHAREFTGQSRPLCGCGEKLDALNLRSLSASRVVPWQWANIVALVEKAQETLEVEAGRSA